MIFKDRKRRVWLAIKLPLDVLIALAAFLAAFALRYGADLTHPIALITGREFAPYREIFFMAPAIRVVFSFMTGLYRPKDARNKIDALFTVFKAVSLGSLVIVVILFSYRGLFEYRTFSYSRLVVLLDWGINLVLVVGARVLIAYIDGWLKFSGIGLKKVLFVGYNDEVGRIIDVMAKDGRLGCKVEGYVGGERQGAAARYLGQKDGLVGLLQERSIDEVYVVDTYFTQEEIIELSAWCDKLNTDLRIVPSLYMVMTRSAVVDEIGDIPTILVKKGGIRGWDRVLKELEDYVLSALLLAALSPVMLVIAAMILLDSRGSVFYKQERVGRNGRRFMIYKFRSMVKDADRIQGGLMDANEADGPIFKMRNDPRVTMVGKLIRKTSMDELPQLLNVVRGEMSLVGPRPPIPGEVDGYEDWQKERLAAQPGITGLWQVSGRSALSFDDMAKLDIYYIRNWSLWLDLKILLKTVPAVLFSKGAY